MSAAGAPPRSYLFVPGSRPERFAKAQAAVAHAVIVDLEDAVPAAEKTGARAAIAAALPLATPVLVRINAAGTPWFDDDLALCRHAGVAASASSPRTPRRRARRSRSTAGWSIARCC